MRCLPASSALVLGALVLASACQHMPPKPLNLATHGEALAARPMSVEPVAAYADALARSPMDGPAVFDLADGLSLREAEAVALCFNSGVLMARLEAEHAASLADAAGRWDDPDLGLEGGRKRAEGGSRTREVTIEPSADAPLGSSYSFRQEAERTVERAWVRSASLSITIPTSGRLGAERQARRTVHEAALLAVAETEWQTLVALRAAWLAWSAEVERLRLMDAHLEVLGHFSSMAGSLEVAGELLPSDARLFAIEHGRLSAQRERIHHEAVGMRTHLLQVMGLLPDAPVELIASLGVVEPHAPVDDFAMLVAQSHPTIMRLRAEYDAAEDWLRVELRRQYPDITLSPLFTDEQDETSLVLGLGIPVPVWNANRLGIAEAVAARDVARARVESEFHAILAQVAQRESEWAGARAQYARLSDEVAPLVDLQLDEVQTLLRLGELDIVMVHQTLTQALDIKGALLEATVAEQSAAAWLQAVIPATAQDSIHNEEMKR